MKKNFTALILASLMAISLAGCQRETEPSASAESANPAPSSSVSAESEETSDPAADAIAARIETQTIVLSWFTFTGSPNGLGRIQEKMNELTIPALNLEVEMQVTDLAQRSQQLTLQISGGEQLDIVSSWGLTYTTGIQNGYFEDLEQTVDGYNLLETYGQNLLETIPSDWLDACRTIDGTLYGIPNQRVNAQGRYCIAVDTETLKKAEAAMDLTPDYENEVWRINGLEDLSAIIKALHETSPEMDAFAPNGAVAGWTSVDPLGGDSFGVLIDWGIGQTEVVNFFETDTYRESVGVIRDLYLAGCINPSDLTDTTAVSARIKAGSLASYVTNYKPGSKIQETNLCGQDITIVLGGPDNIHSTSICGNPWAICVNTEDIVASMQYMDFMFSSSEWNELFNWGEEGVDFEVVEQTAQIKDDAEYSHALQWMSPGQFLTYPAYGNPTDIWDQFEDFNNNAIISDASGFAMDKTNVSTEYTAVTNVYNEYQYSIEYGAVDPETAIQEMNDKMYAAGLQKIIDEKQQQYTAWREVRGK